MEQYSVLMSVYHKENAKYLISSIDSMLSQTIPPAEFVLVCDGPLTEQLDAVIAAFCEKYPDIMKLVRLEKNVGLGSALNEGLRACSHELIARMDSDDIARPDRCQRQLAVFAQDPQVGMVSGTVEEFAVTPDLVDARRELPETHEEILRFARKRNPFNHPCMMYRKSEVEAAGGYQHFYLLEDYWLWIRMLTRGTIGYNIPQPLLWMRAGSDMYKRRAGWKYAKEQIKLFRRMKTMGFISSWSCMTSCAIRTASALAPNWLRKRVFAWKLRA